MSSSSSIKTGLIGFGLSGQVFHAPFILQHPDMSLTAVSSRQQEQVQAVAPDATVFASAQDLIKRSDIDLVVITAPNDQHFPLARDALTAGKHVLLEKPSVTQLDQMDHLIELADARNRVLTVYQNRRFDGDFQHLSQLCGDTSQLGRLRHLDTRFDRFRPEPRDRWREQPGEGSGIFWDLGPHLLDQVLCLLGPPESLQARLRNLRTGSQTTDWFEVSLQYPHTEVVAGSTPFEAGDMRRFNARFDQGSWQCWGLDPQEAVLRDGIQPGDATYLTAGTLQSARTFGQTGVQDAQVASGDYRQFYDQLVSAVNGLAQPPVSLEHARQLVYLMNLAETSAQSGRQESWAL